MSPVVSELISALSWINAKIKEVPRGILSRPSALHRDVRITARREQLLPALKSIAGMPEPAAFRRDQEVKAVAQGYPARMADHAEPGALRGRAEGRALRRPDPNAEEGCLVGSGGGGRGMAARSVLASKLSVLAAHSAEASVSLVWRHVASFGPRRPLRAAGSVGSASQPKCEIAREACGSWTC